MSFPVEFSKEGIAYGVLYSMAPTEQPHWEMSFYTSESGRKRGISYLHKLLGSYCPIITFEVTLKELMSRGMLTPGIPDEKHRELVNVVEAEFRFRHKKANEN